MVTIPHKLMPICAGYEYERPSEEERELVKSFPLSDYGIDIAVYIDEGSATLKFQIAGEHSVSHDEWYDVSFRALFDETFSDHMYGDGSIAAESAALLLNLAAKLDIEASHIRAVIASAQTRPAKG